MVWSWLLGSESGLELGSGESGNMERNELLLLLVWSVKCWIGNSCERCWFW